MAEEKTEVPQKSYRWLENIHILLWLIKDTCWAMEWKPGAVAMIIPTISVALYLLYRSKRNKTELYHNAAVCLWIIANSTWMIGEFINLDLRPIAAILFGIGVGILTIYYSVYFRKDRIDEKKEEISKNYE
jgi:hypothetical protein